VCNAPPPMEPAFGLGIDRRYALVRRLGDGGMGYVWLARDRDTGAEVALKLPMGTPDDDEQLLERFRREAEVGAKVDSPYLVKVIEHGVTDEGLPFIAMEHVAGEDLFTRILEQRWLPLTETRQIVAQSCLALQALHARGIVHRDVKPANILVADGRHGLEVKLADFGLAWEMRASHVTHANMIVGTPLYMSPERLTARDVDPACDLWSVAVVAYECLTGRPPFVGGSFGAICISIGRGLIAPVCELRPGLPHELDAWFDAALNPDPSKRFATAEELAASFDAACDGDAVVRPVRRGMRGSARSSWWRRALASPMVFLGSG
jgi:eukaryotic-like serine/threonine-protein kinase